MERLCGCIVYNAISEHPCEEAMPGVCSCAMSTPCFQTMQLAQSCAVSYSALDRGNLCMKAKVTDTVVQPEATCYDNRHASIF
jgi:hypothetical protein